jgi:hypothetical protein
MQNYLQSLLNYFNNAITGNNPPAGYTPGTTTTQAPPVVGTAPSPNNYRFVNGKPVADLPEPGEKTLDIYPTVHSLEPTKLNKGTPWAAQKVPEEYLGGMAYAQAKAKSIGLLDDETLNQMLPLATRESRYKDYGNNGVFVDYKTPPPKELAGTIAEADKLRSQELKLESQIDKAYKLKNMPLFDDLVLKRKELEDQRKKIDSKILANSNWISRAESYNDISDKVEKLGLQRSTEQDLIRDQKGRIISKADVYRAHPADTYETKALHVPLALYNKRYENPEAKGLALTKTFVGKGEEAAARNKQEAEIARNIYSHQKNKPVMDYYTNQYNKYYTEMSKGKR